VAESKVPAAGIDGKSGMGKGKPLYDFLSEATTGHELAQKLATVARAEVKVEQERETAQIEEFCLTRNRHLAEARLEELRADAPAHSSGPSCQTPPVFVPRQVCQQDAYENKLNELVDFAVRNGLPTEPGPKFGEFLEDPGGYLTRERHLVLADRMKARLERSYEEKSTTEVSLGLKRGRGALGSKAVMRADGDVEEFPPRSPRRERSPGGTVRRVRRYCRIVGTQVYLRARGSVLEFILAAERQEKREKAAVVRKLYAGHDRRH
jgi:hypothetical protein